MNKIVLVGRLIKDPELKIVESNDKMYTKFIIAVERNFKSADGFRESDLIPVIMWGRKADVLCNHLHKGSEISLSGRLKIDKYLDKDGIKRYSANVVAEDFKFVGNRRIDNVADGNIENSN